VIVEASVAAPSLLANRSAPDRSASNVTVPPEANDIACDRVAKHASGAVTNSPSGCSPITRRTQCDSAPGDATAGIVAATSYTIENAAISDTRNKRIDTTTLTSAGDLYTYLFAHQAPKVPGTFRTGQEQHTGRQAGGNTRSNLRRSTPTTPPASRASIGASPRGTLCSA